MSSADKTEAMPFSQMAPARSARPEASAPPVAHPMRPFSPTAVQGAANVFFGTRSSDSNADVVGAAGRPSPAILPPPSMRGPDRSRVGRVAVPSGPAGRVLPLAGPPPKLHAIEGSIHQALATGGGVVGKKLGNGVASSAYEVSTDTGKSTGYVLLVTKSATTDTLVQAERHHRAIAAAVPGVLPEHGGIAFAEKTGQHGQLLQAVDGTMAKLVDGRRDPSNGMPILENKTLTGQDVAALGSLIGTAFQRMAQARVGYVDHKPANLGFVLADGDCRPAQQFSARSGGVYQSPWHQVLVLDVGAAKTPEYLTQGGEADRSLTPNSVPRNQAVALIRDDDANLRRIQASSSTYSQAMAEHLYAVVTGRHSQDREIDRVQAQNPALALPANATRLQHAVVIARAYNSSAEAVNDIKRREEDGVLPKGFAAAFDDGFAGRTTPEQFARALTDAAGLTRPERRPGLMGWLRLR